MEATSSTDSRQCVLAAVDLGRSTERVLRHAAGFARVFSLPLKAVQVSATMPAGAHQKVVDLCARKGPYAVDLAPEDVLLRHGIVSEAIYRTAISQGARLIVMGSRARSHLAAALLGSTSQAVLRNAPAPVLLVPPNDIDIVDIDDRARLTCGPVLAAIDLMEFNEAQLRLAGEISRLADQPLYLTTVVSRDQPNQTYSSMLLTRSRRSQLTPRAVFVRHGDIAKEIAQCAVAANAGLVVMGLRARGRGRPGAIASTLLRTGPAFICAVPQT